MNQLPYFMAYDLAASVAAVLLFPAFVFVPGYAAGWWLDLLDFRRRTFAFRAALSIPLSIGIVPIVSYLAGVFFSMTCVWGIFVFAWIFFAWTLARDSPKQWMRSQRWRFPIVAGAVWTVVALFSLVDLQIGHRLYYSTIALDFSVRTQFIQAITAGGIPPHNPFFLSGHPDFLHYHYFWLIPCSLVDTIGGEFVTARHAWIGGTVWCGLGLIALVTLFFRVFWYTSPGAFRRRSTAAILLLGVTGLDLLPTLFLKGLEGRVLPSVEWWNEQVDSFTWTALWEAHYTAGFIAAFIGFLLLWEAPGRTGAARWKHALVGGFALATSLGAAVYVGMAFGLFLAFWMVVVLVKKRWEEGAVLAVAGVLCGVLALPFLLSLESHAPGAAVGGFPFAFTVRRFLLVDRVLKLHGLGQQWRLNVFNSALLPLNYALELGFFLGATCLWWKKRRRNAEPLSRTELALVTMTATSLLVCTFVRSTVIDNNDLGWRAFLIAQFGMLLWSADLVSDRSYVRSGILSTMLALGIAGTAYDVTMLRFYPVLADAGAFPHLIWMSGDRHLGERNYDVREGYEWIRRNSPPGAVVQFDPHPVWQDTPAFLYADRQIAAADEDCLAGFGGDAALCPPLMARVNSVFPENPAAASSSDAPISGAAAVALASQQARPVAASLADACRAVPARMLLAKDTDEVWKRRESWVWMSHPTFQNARVRVFDCAGAMASRVLSGETAPLSALAPE